MLSAQTSEDRVQARSAGTIVVADMQVHMAAAIIKRRDRVGAENGVNHQIETALGVERARGLGRPTLKLRNRLEGRTPGAKR